jgi:(2S)-methylsuccinyl-CoA dehydrogenase
LANLLEGKSTSQGNIESKSPMNSVTTPLMISAPASTRELLVQTRSFFEYAVQALAQQCSVSGALDSERVDIQQPACFELAWASADLLAAETVMSTSDASDAVPSALNVQLSLCFAVEAIQAVIQRLESIYRDLDLDTSALSNFSVAPTFTDLKSKVLSSKVLSDLGSAVSRVSGEIAEIKLDDDLALAQDSFRRFSSEQVAPLAGDIHRHDLTVPETLLQPLRDMGVFGLSIPEVYGGSAPEGSDNTLMMVAVTEALSEGSLAAAGSLITRPEILARALMSGGSDAQKSYWLPKIAIGEPLCAISITEPDYGSDVASLSLKATRTEGGWLLNGAKTWCTFAGKAGLIMVVARTDADRSSGHKGLSIMLVEKPSYEGHEFSFEQDIEGAHKDEAHKDGAHKDGAHKRGKLSGRAIPTIGYRGMHSFDLAFENFFVPDNRVIGEEKGVGRGFYFTMAGMVGGRIQTAARACGVMRASLSAALQYCLDRQVFGAPLMNFKLTQVKIARMAARFNACRQLTYEVARRLEAGGDRMEASLVKLLACRSAEIISRESLQLHGGMGYAEEMAVSRYFVDARVLSIFEGAEETLALKVVARTLLENGSKAAA